MGSAAGGNATTGNSLTDGLSRLHRMTLDEAKLILNLKQATEAEKEQLVKVCCFMILMMTRADIRATIEQNYEHLFATNAPPAPKGKSGGGSGSFYVQSKIVRARERIEAEWKEVAKAFEQQKAVKDTPTPPPPSPPTGGSQAGL